jgi:hypothetical protein
MSIGIGLGKSLAYLGHNCELLVRSSDRACVRIEHLHLPLSVLSTRQGVAVSIVLSTVALGRY